MKTQEKKQTDAHEAITMGATPVVAAEELDPGRDRRHRAPDDTLARDGSRGDAGGERQGEERQPEGWTHRDLRRHRPAHRGAATLLTP